MTSYKIRVKSGSNQDILEQEVSSRNRVFSISGLNPASKYRIDIGAKRQENTSKMATIVAQTLPNPPKVRIGKIGKDEVVMVIIKPDHSITGYMAFLEHVDRIGSRPRRIPIKKDSRKVKLNKLQPGADYYFTIISLEGNLQSGKNEVQFMTRPAPLEKLRYDCIFNYWSSEFLFNH